MKFFRFGQTALSIRRPLLDAMTDACLSLDQLTQASLAVEAGTSLASAGKLLNSLCETGFLVFSSRQPENGGKICRHYRFRETALIVILELGSSDVSLTVTDLCGNCILQNQWVIDRSISYCDNLEHLLSHTVLSIEKLSGGLAAISVILPEKRTCVFGELSAHLPGIEDKPKIDLLCSKLLGQAPLLYLFPPQAMYSASRYALFPGDPKSDLTYIHINDRFSVYHCPAEGEIRHLHTEHLLIDEQTADEALNGILANDRLGDLLSRIINLSHCCFEAGRYFIESEIIHPGLEVLQKIKRSFFLSNSSLPDLYLRHKEVSALVLGASKLCVRELLNRHIKASKE